MRAALPSIRASLAGVARRRPAPASDPAPPAERPIDGAVSCAACGRFPLVGERVTLHAGSGRAEWACEPCEGAGRGEPLGAVRGRDRVRSVGGAANVRRAA
jgi:hypothetical protein